MSTNVPNYRWSVDNFLRAWDAGAFDGRVELISGEIWPVVIRDWHGETVFRLSTASDFRGSDHRLDAAQREFAP